MNPNALAAAISGAAAAAALAVGAVMLVGTDEPPPARPTARARLVSWGRLVVRGRGRTITIAGTTGLAVWLISGWPAAGLITAGAVFALPWFFTAGRDAARHLERLAGLEEWVRRLADATSAGAAPLQAIVATAQHPPAAIAGEVHDLSAALANPRTDKHLALRQFADRIGDPAGDMAVLAIDLAVTGTGTATLPDLLRTLARQLADDVGARRKTETERAEPRSEARTIVIIQIAVVVIVCTATRYAESYGTLTGQLALLILAAVVASALVSLRRLSSPRPPARILDPLPQRSPAPTRKVDR